MKKSVALAALLACAGTPALAQGMVMAAPPGMGAPMSTEGFRLMALQSDAFEIESSRIALQRSRNPAVQRFAQMMIGDHAATSQALNGGRPVYAGLPGGTVGGAATGAIVGAVVGGPVGAVVGGAVGATAGAAGGGMAPAGGVALDARHAAMLNQLASIPPGPRFDAAYGGMQVQAHQEAVAMFAAYAQGGSDPAMRGFAQQALPSLQHHLAMAARLPGARGAMRVR
jgi:predicted outer membrane protein